MNELVDEIVQSERAGWRSEEDLHECCCLFGEVVPVEDCETGGGDESAQLVGGGWVAQFGLVGPRERVGELAWCADGRVG
jgi:hypothetical protein